MVVEEHQGHNIMARDATVLAREDNFQRRKISEAIKIGERHPEIKQDGGYSIPAIFMKLLLCDTQHVGYMTLDNSAL